MRAQDSGTDALIHVFQGNTYLANLSFYRQLKRDGQPVESEYIGILDPSSSSSSAVSGLRRNRLPNLDKLAAGDR